MSTPDEARCERCRHWQAVDTGGDLLGECRRFPPAIAPGQEPSPGGVGYKGHWPLTWPNEWCGEFRPAPLPPAGGLDSLGLQARTRNALERYGICTVAALASKNAEEVVSLPNIGSGSLGAIRRALAARGLALRDEPRADAPAVVEGSRP